MVTKAPTNRLSLISMVVILLITQLAGAEEKSIRCIIKSRGDAIEDVRGARELFEKLNQTSGTIDYLWSLQTCTREIKAHLFQSFSSYDIRVAKAAFPLNAQDCAELVVRRDRIGAWIQSYEQARGEHRAGRSSTPDYCISGKLVVNYTDPCDHSNPKHISVIPEPQLAELAHAEAAAFAVEKKNSDRPISEQPHIKNTTETPTDLAEQLDSVLNGDPADFSIQDEVAREDSEAERKRRSAEELRRDSLAKLPSKKQMFDKIKYNLINHATKEAATLKFGENQIDLELIESKNKIRQGYYEDVKEKLPQIVNDYRAKLIGTPGTDDEKINLVVSWLVKDGYIPKYVKSQAKISDALENKMHGANCEAQTKIIISTLQGLGLKPTEGKSLSVQLFDDHVQAVVYDPKKDEVWALLGNTKRTGVVSTIYEPLIFELGYLNAYKIKAPVSADALVVAKTNIQTTTTSAGVFDFLKTNTFLSLPKTGVRFSEEAPPETASVERRLETTESKSDDEKNKLATDKRPEEQVKEAGQAGSTNQKSSRAGGKGTGVGGSNTGAAGDSDGLDKDSNKAPLTYSESLTADSENARGYHKLLFRPDGSIRSYVYHNMVKRNIFVRNQDRDHYNQLSEPEKKKFLHQLDGQGIREYLESADGETFLKKLEDGKTFGDLTPQEISELRNVISPIMNSGRDGLPEITQSAPIVNARLFPALKKVLQTYTDNPELGYRDILKTKPIVKTPDGEEGDAVGWLMYWLRKTEADTGDSKDVLNAQQSIAHYMMNPKNVGLKLTVTPKDPKKVKEVRETNLETPIDYDNPKAIPLKVAQAPKPATKPPSFGVPSKDRSKIQVSLNEYVSRWEDMLLSSGQNQDKELQKELMQRWTPEFSSIIRIQSKRDYRPGGLCATMFYKNTLRWHYKDAIESRNNPATLLYPGPEGTRIPRDIAILFRDAMICDIKDPLWARPKGFVYRDPHEYLQALDDALGDLKTHL